jgi:chromate transport protein ChrA
MEAARIFPQAIVAVFLPRVIEHYGKTNSVSECMKLCKKPVIGGFFVVCGLVAMIMFVLPYIVPILMPNYIDAIFTMQLIMLDLPLAILALPNALVIAIGKLTEQNIATYVSLCIFLILALIAVKMDFGLNGIIIASLISKTIRIGFIYFIIYRVNLMDQRNTYLE